MTELKRAREIGHETREANAKGIFWFGLAMVVTAIVIHLSLGAMFFSLRTKSHDEARPTFDPRLASPRTPPPEPRFQTNPQADLQKYLDRERKLLSTTGAVPGRTDVIHIPIERAMEILSHE